MQRINWRGLAVAAVLGGLLLASLPAEAATPPCGPAPAQNGSRFYVDMNASGFAVLWYCNVGNGWLPQAFYGHWAELPGDWLYQAPKLLYATKLEQDAAWALHTADTDINYTNTVLPLLTGMRAANDAQYPVPVAVPRVTHWVQPTSATVVGDRPVFRLKADGTRNTTPVSGVRAIGKTPCTTQLGTTNYYLVPSLGYYAICQLVP